MPNPGRRLTKRIHELATPALGTGEEIATSGRCWATRQRLGVPLLFLARHQYLLVLTNRRLLVFEGRGRTAGSLSLGKRFETLELVRVRTRRLLSQVTVSGAGDVPLVFEFRPRNRALGAALVRALDRSATTGAEAAATAAPPPAAASAEAIPVATSEFPAPTEAFRDKR
ncbi:MAG TPA: hypothetical protein VFW06_06640 [Acidimicrobiia bacterium]|nr:hypothetical protein [Acidimicrobiia bacterium]